MVILKAIEAITEISLGVLAFFISHDVLVAIVNWFTHRELLTDPGDPFSQYLVSTATSYTPGIQMFVLLYLLSHGILKLVLVVSLIKRQLWAYPTAMFVFTLFIVYQMYEYFKLPNVSIIVLTVLDLIVIVLTYIEYQALKRQKIV